MKVLLDENIDIRFKKLLTGHEVFTNTLKYISALAPFVLSTLESEPGKKIIVLSEKNQRP